MNPPFDEARGTLLERMARMAQQLDDIGFTSLAKLLREAAREIELQRDIAKENAMNG